MTLTLNLNHARPQVMAERVTTSKALIAEWMNPERGNRHFTKWIKDKQVKAIRTCGLSLSNYTNKSKRTEILSHLTTLDTHFTTIILKRSLGW